jgi:hypothetical protein
MIETKIRNEQWRGVLESTENASHNFDGKIKKKTLQLQAVNN